MDQDDDRFIDPEILKARANTLLAKSRIAGQLTRNDLVGVVDDCNALLDDLAILLARMPDFPSGGG